MPGAATFPKNAIVAIAAVVSLIILGGLVFYFIGQWGAEDSSVDNVHAVPNEKIKNKLDQEPRTEILEPSEEIDSRKAAVTAPQTDYHRMVAKLRRALEVDPKSIPRILDSESSRVKFTGYRAVASMLQDPLLVPPEGDLSEILKAASLQLSPVHYEDVFGGLLASLAKESPEIASELLNKRGPGKYRNMLVQAYSRSVYQNGSSKDWIEIVNQLSFEEDRNEFTRVYLQMMATDFADAKIDAESFTENLSGMAGPTRDASLRGAARRLSVSREGLSRFFEVAKEVPDLREYRTSAISAALEFNPKLFVERLDEYEARGYLRDEEVLQKLADRSVSNPSLSKEIFELIGSTRQREYVGAVLDSSRVGIESLDYLHDFSIALKSESVVGEQLAGEVEDFRDKLIERTRLEGEE